MNISHASTGSSQNPTRGKTNGKGADTKPNPQKQPTTPPKFDPKEAAKMDQVRRNVLTIATAKIQVSPGTKLRNLVVVPKTGETLSKGDKADNRSLRHFADILDRKETLDANQEKRLAEIIQRRTPPNVETPQKEEEEEEAGGYAALYSRVKSGLRSVSSWLPDSSSLPSISMGLWLASSVARQIEGQSADQDPYANTASTTLKPSDVLATAANMAAMAKSVIDISKQVANYREGKPVKTLKVVIPAAQFLYGAASLGGDQVAGAARFFAGAGFAAKAFQTQSLTDAGAAIASAWSVAVGGDSVALANTVLAYSQLIQGGVSVWRKLEADAAQQAEAAVLRQLVTILEKPVTTEAEANAVTAKAVAFLKSTGVGSRPQTSELGKLFHSFRNLPETATHTLGLLLAPLCSLGKPSSSNLGTYLAVSLLGLNLLPGANAQGVNQQLADLRLIAARINETATEQAQQIKALINVQVESKAELVIQKELTARLTLALEEANKKLQEVTYLAGNQTIAIAASNEAIAENAADNADNAADNEYTRRVGFTLAGVAVAAATVMLISYAIKHCCFPTKAAKDPNTLAQNLMAAAARNQLLAKQANQALINTMSGLSHQLTDLWDVRSALSTQVSRPFITGAIAAAPEEPENAATLRTTLAELEIIRNTLDDDMTPDTLGRMGELLKTLRRLNEPAQTNVTALTEAIANESTAARATIAANQENLQHRPPYIELQEFRRLGLGVDQSADACIQQVLDPGDLGDDDAPEALTADHVAAMANALVANRNVQGAITTETTAIKAAARGLFANTTERLGWLSHELSAPIQDQIAAFNEAVALTNAQGSQTPANFDTAFTRRDELTGAWRVATNAACQEVVDGRDGLQANIATLTEFRALGLGLDQTADAALAELNIVIPGIQTPATFGNLQEADFRNLATALDAAHNVPYAIAEEIGAIVQHVRQSVATQQDLNARIPNIEGLELATLADFTRTSAALAGVGVGGGGVVPNPVPFGEAIATRTALRREIIAYVNDGSQAIDRILRDTAEDRAALAGLLDLAGTVNVHFNGTDTQESLRLLTSENLPAAVETDEALDGVTQAQFGALAAARPVLDTFADTIADETREIQAGLVAKLGEERQRIEALPPRLSALIETELGNFATESAKISDDDATHTLANFTTVFAAIAAVKTAAADADKRETAAVKLQGVRRQFLASRQALHLYRTAVQAQLQAQQDINGSLGVLRNSITATLFHTFEETSEIALQAGATKEQLAIANTARQALRDAITVATEEGLASVAQVQRRLDASQSASPSAARTPRQTGNPSLSNSFPSPSGQEAASPATPLNVSSGSNPSSTQNLERRPNPDEFVINIHLAGAAEEKGRAPQDGDIEEGFGGGGDY
jgi:hypothetical protein